MDAKLTLKLNQSVIEDAKKYAQSKNTSVSKLVEAYLGKLTESKASSEITPLVKSLSGIIELPRKYDYKQEYKKYLLNKFKK